MVRRHGGSLFRLRSSIPSAHSPFRCSIPFPILVIALALGVYLIASSAVDAPTRSHTIDNLPFPVTLFTCHTIYTAITRSVVPREGL